MWFSLNFQYFKSLSLKYAFLLNDHHVTFRKSTIHCNNEWFANYLRTMFWSVFCPKEWVRKNIVNHVIFPAQIHISKPIDAPYFSFYVWFSCYSDNHNLLTVIEAVGLRRKILFNPPFLWKCLCQVRAIAVFPVFRLLTDFVCLLTYEFCLSFWNIARCSVILLLPLFKDDNQVILMWIWLILSYINLLGSLLRSPANNFIFWLDRLIFSVSINSHLYTIYLSPLEIRYMKAVLHNLQFAWNIKYSATEHILCINMSRYLFCIYPKYVLKCRLNYLTV